MAFRPPPAACSSQTRPDKDLVGRKETNFMNAIKLLWLTIVNLAKQASLLPQATVLALHQRRARITRRQFEVERLDRIRNPSKYAGR
jgi:hypothetical protein